MMKAHKLITTLLMVAALAGAVATVSGCGEKAANQSGGQAKKYTCSMHPEVMQDKAGSCPKCGMALVEKR